MKLKETKPLFQAIVLPGHHDYGAEFFKKIWMTQLAKKNPFLWRL
jgi:hypothetical protein